MYWPNFKSVAFPIPEIIAGGVANPQSRKRRGAWVGNGTVRKSVGDVL